MHIKKQFFLLSFILHLSAIVPAQKNGLELLSPNGTIKVAFHVSDKIYYTISYQENVLVKDNSLGLQLRTDALGRNPKLAEPKEGNGSEVSAPYIALKFAAVHNKPWPLRLARWLLWPSVRTTSGLSAESPMAKKRCETLKSALIFCKKAKHIQ